jgi:hypothetical protein
MLITIHNLAVNYKLLPSEVLAKGTTFDLFVSDTYQRWMKYHEAKAKGKAPPVSSKKHSKDELQAMINDARAYAEKERKKK